LGSERKPRVFRKGNLTREEPTQGRALLLAFIPVPGKISHRLATEAQNILLA
jgi:hypothetical protein